MPCQKLINAVLEHSSSFHLQRTDWSTLNWFKGKKSKKKALQRAVLMGSQIELSFELLLYWELQSVKEKGKRISQCKNRPPPPNRNQSTFDTNVYYFHLNQIICIQRHSDLLIESLLSLPFWFLFTYSFFIFSFTVYLGSTPDTIMLQHYVKFICIVGI